MSLGHEAGVSDTPSPVDSPSAEPLSPGLYLVATPIGNLGDITLRAIDILRRCDGVACEDTRVTGKLMKHLGISQPLWRYDDHTGEKDRARLVESMHSRAVALVSDAGTPGISDPGFRIVNACRAEGIPVTVIPGACAAIAGLTLSGLPNDRFLFGGFLPAKDKARRDVLEELGGSDATLIFYETSPRLGKTLAVLEQIMPDREIAVGRELTKLHEECRRGLASGLLAYFDGNPPKGEIVLMIAPPEPCDLGEEDVFALLREAMRDMKPSQAAAQVARQTGFDRKQLYARAMEMKGE